jgi:hypothetical protein
MIDLETGWTVPAIPVHDIPAVNRLHYVPAAGPQQGPLILGPPISQQAPVEVMS